MGCGPSRDMVKVGGATSPGKVANGKTADPDEPDDLPTVVLPDTPAQAKPPVAFEIPVEEFDGNRRPSNTPPAHLQRLLQPPQPDISLPEIEEKLAEAEQRRLSILQQRAASAQKRAQKMIRSVHELDTLAAEHEPTETNKLGTNTLTIPPEPGVCEDKNIA
ncbi:uncharacterized protein LOC115441514 [Manduca sexta]|uniref:Stathmin n=1 Tax=Manduca sexta TaxID=7130 RepID=A0A922CC84_MANSE|nr:uncharacterized protein LOC115441514 [Manduca sexta]KAG6440781.1 hypothetical protein O3G_MSEX001512 [Manduca sexta]